VEATLGIGRDARAPERVARPFDDRAGERCSLRADHAPAQRRVALHVDRDVVVCFRAEDEVSHDHVGVAVGGDAERALAGGIDSNSKLPSAFVNALGARLA